MNPQYTIIFALAGMVFVIFVFGAIWASRYTKVGLNQVLIVSGRKIQLPDGTFAGCRIVKGGGTFVFPVIERADLLSLEVVTIEMPKSKVRGARDGPVEVDCVAQVKIKGDDASIIAAAEHFLGKSTEDMKNIVRPLLEKLLRTTLSDLSLAEGRRNPDALADKVQAAATEELDKTGLGMISFTIQDLRAG